MINLTELRLGNYVIVEKGGYCSNRSIQIVKSISEKGINEWSDMGASGAVKPEDLTPIPLTQDWLIKFGFDTEDCEVDFMEYSLEYEEGSYLYSICNIGGLYDHDKHPFYVELENAGQRNGWQTNSKIILRQLYTNLHRC